MTNPKARTSVTVTGLVCLILFIWLFASSDEQTIKSVKGGGVILTFDDDAVAEWFDANRKLSKYNWKATFFVSDFHTLETDEINRLKVLKDVGHEIASHGYNHLNAQDFISRHSLKKYLENEVFPSLNDMKEEGFEVRSFAYPFGATIRFNLTGKLNYLFSGNKINALDKQLLSHFDLIRKTTYEQKPPTNQTNYANGTKILFGLGTDVIYENDVEYLLDILRYAKENNKIAIFYGHGINKKEEDSKYTTDISTLERICQYVDNNDMQFLTMKDLLTDQ